MTDLLKALAIAKGSFEPIKKSGLDPCSGASFATLGDVLTSIRLALSVQGLILSQPLAIVDGVTVLKTTVFYVRVGEKEAEEMHSLLPITISSDPQKFGSLLNCYRRYALCSLLGIDTGDDDNGASIKPDPRDRIPTVQEHQEAFDRAEGERKAKQVNDARIAAGMSVDAMMSIAKTISTNREIRAFNPVQITKLINAIKKQA
jgi:ERF superfamily